MPSVFGARLIVSGTSITGSFILGANPVDASSRPSLPFGTFGLVHTPDQVLLRWTPAPPFQVWCYQHFGSSWNEPIIAGPERDPDGDGWTNHGEWTTGSVPNDAASFFAVTYANQFLSFMRLSDRTYRVETTSDPWESWVLHQSVPSGTGTIQLPLPIEGPRRFFRVAISYTP